MFFDVPRRSICAVYDAPQIVAPMDNAEALRNAFRCALDDLASAEHLYSVACKQLGHANRARVEAHNWQAPRAVQKAQAMRTVNLHRKTLRAAQRASLAALDALAVIPGAAARILEMRSM
jgi:hypothetical protein